MEVSIFAVAKLIILGAVLFNSVEASAQIELAQCSVDEDHGPIRQCVVLDSTGDVYYEGEDITALLTIDLPMTILLECMADLNKIAIVSPSGNVMVTGREIKSKQDKGRWFVEYTFQTDDNHGRLTITLHIKSVNWNDHQILHVEIRGNDVTYKTSDWDWIIVTIGHPTTEDPWDMTQATVEVLENENLALREENKILKDDLIYSQAANIQCLKSNNSLDILRAKAEYLEKDNQALREENKILKDDLIHSQAANVQCLKCNNSLDILQAKAEYLDKDNQALREENKILKDDLIHSQAANVQCLKCNNSLDILQAKVEYLEKEKLAILEEIQKKASQDRKTSHALGFVTVCLLLVLIAVGIFYMLKNFKIEPKVIDGARSDQWTLSAQEYVLVKNNHEQPLHLNPVYEEQVPVHVF